MGKDAPRRKACSRQSARFASTFSILCYFKMSKSLVINGNYFVCMYRVDAVNSILWPFSTLAAVGWRLFQEIASWHHPFRFIDPIDSIDTCSHLDSINEARFKISILSHSILEWDIVCDEFIHFHLMASFQDDMLWRYIAHCWSSMYKYLSVKIAWKLAFVPALVCCQWETREKRERDCGWVWWQGTI